MNGVLPASSRRRKTFKNNNLIGSLNDSPKRFCFEQFVINRQNVQNRYQAIARRRTSCRLQRFLQRLATCGPCEEFAESRQESGCCPRKLVRISMKICLSNETEMVAPFCCSFLLRLIVSTVLFSLSSNGAAAIGFRSSECVSCIQITTILRSPRAAECVQVLRYLRAVASRC